MATGESLLTDVVVRDELSKHSQKRSSGQYRVSSIQKTRKVEKSHW